jgi:hypothetical protein
MKFQLLHRAVKGTPVVSLNTVTRAVHIRLLARQIHNTHVLPTTTATRPARLRCSLPAAALLFSSPTAPCVMTVMRMRLLACGRMSGQPKEHSCGGERAATSWIHLSPRRAGRLSPRAAVDPAPPTITRTTTSFAIVRETLLDSSSLIDWLWIWRMDFDAPSLCE